jgi:tetratricopeptide (TPR) repeat protein
LKIAVYTIAKNEEQFAARWAKSCEDADYRIVLDTGSADDTVNRLKDNRVVVRHGSIAPWRFDDARNAALSQVPLDTDICIALDMDEVLCPGWRSALQNHVSPDTTRPTYVYTWSWNADGSPGLTYHGDKIHRRASHRWRHPVHEVLTPVVPEHRCFVPGLKIHHHPDPTKSRAQYLPLLELAVREDPTDDRNQHYLGREYVFVGRWDDALRTLEAHLANPRATWNAERAASLRYMARAYMGKDEPARARDCLMRAIQEAPNEREPWVALLDWAYRYGQWELGLWAATNTLKIVERPQTYICEADAWGAKPYDLGSLCAWYSGAHERARGWCRTALLKEPGDPRLKMNFSLMGGQLDSLDTVPASV